MTKTEMNNKIKEMILEENKSKEEILNFVKKDAKEYILTPSTLGMIYEVFCDIKQNETDQTKFFTKEIKISELEKIHKSFVSTNGCQWARDDVSYIGKKYHIVRKHKNGRIYSVKLDGPNTSSTRKYKDIRSDIKTKISQQRCAVLDIGTNIEVDHKDGKYDNLNNIDLASQKETDFQPMSKSANDAKRQHCKKCRESGKRYDAKNLGYKCGWIAGDENSKTCVGCYWYDPKQFNQKISENF